MLLRVLCVNENAKDLYKNHKQPFPGDAGLDLFCVSDITIGPGETVKVPLGIKVSAHRSKDDLENSLVFYIFPRSSISKTPLRLANSVGLIDAGYRGELIGLFDNIKDYAYTIHKGDRLLQIVAPDHSEISFEIVESLSDTERGTGGIGSTGV